MIEKIDENKTPKKTHDVGRDDSDEAIVDASLQNPN